MGISKRFLRNYERSGIYEWPANCRYDGMHPELRKFTNGQARIRRALALCIGSLLLIAFINFSLIAGESEKNKHWPESQKPRADQASLSREEISEARRLLASLGYWIDPDDLGRDAQLRHALIAFQKIEGRKSTGKLTADELQALRGARSPEAREAGEAHVEVDLKRQVLFIVDAGGAILKILPISSGSGELFTSEGRTRRAVTPTGRFTVERKIAGWRKSPLGLLYYPNYINDGIAIHGNPSVPATPASHGCIRIPMFAAKEFSEMTPIGMPVLVYDDEFPPLLP